MSDDRSKVRDRIRKLQARQVGRGFTEAEALQAAEMAAALMRDHGLTDDDLVMDRRESRTRGSAGTIRAHLWARVGLCTNTAVTFSRDLDGDFIVWIGHEPGPEIAAYLFDMLKRAIDRELAEFRKTTFYRRRRSAKTKTQAVEEFTFALVRRLAARLNELFGETKSDAALAAAEAARDRAFPNTQSIKPKRPTDRFQEAQMAGAVAGGRVGLHRGVGADDGPAGSIDAPRLQIEGPR